MKYKKIFNLNDGMNPNLVHGALYDGIFQFPLIERPEIIKIPTGFTPFSARHRSLFFEDAIGFNEFDETFSDILCNPDRYYDDLSRFAAMTSPDFSLYRNASITTQIANTYRNRAVGYYFQSRGLQVYPLVRWGDERSYTTSIFPECFAFKGIRKNSIVVVSTYGCIQGASNKDHFKRGLEAMLKELTPEIVLVHGYSPNCVFKEFETVTHFYFFDDWITRMKGGKQNGFR